VSEIDLLLSSLYFFPAYSGPSVRFRHYERGFLERGIRMRVFSSIAESEALIPVGQLVAPERIDGHILMERVCIPNTGSYRRNTIFTKAVVEYCQTTPPQILHLLTLSQWSLFQLRSLRRLGIPTIYTHTMLGQLSSNPLKRRLQVVYWRLPFSMVDCVVTSSRTMQQELINLGVTTRIEIIPNGVDTNRFRPLKNEAERSQLRKSLQLPKTGELVTFVGSLSYRKGIDVLLEAWTLVSQEYRNAHLVLVGPRFEDIRSQALKSPFEARLRDLIATLEAQEQIVLTGVTNKVEDFLRVADLFVFPSRREGMPNVIPEAFASGTPVIMTPFAGLPEEFGVAGRHYVLVDRDPKSLSNSILDMLRDRERRHAIAKNAVDYSNSNMAVQNSLDRYSELYRELLQSTS